jgi:predicted enzyme related to lactoylglutathione lyase
MSGLGDSEAPAVRGTAAVIHATHPASRIGPDKPNGCRNAVVVYPQIACLADNSRHTHHAIDYIEIGVTNFAAKSFYGSAFGWTFNDYGPGPAYVGIRAPGSAEGTGAGGLRLDDEVSPGGPLVLVYSSDLDASVQAVHDAGSEVTEKPYDFPGGRRFHFRYPSGNALGVWSAN